LNLEEIRKKIDRVDIEILNRLHLRAELALLSRRFKEGVVDEEREERVLGNVKQTVRRLVDPDFAERLYRQIMGESRRLQSEDHRLSGFQGEHGAFSEQALMAFKPELVSIPCLEFGDVFEGVERGFLDFGLVPVENSLEGSVHEVNRILTETGLRIAGEIVLPIHHCLLALPETNYREIRVVHSHPQALAQCRSFLARHRLEMKPFYDTAGAARWLASERPPGAGVIAGRLAAELYGLETIKENVEDHPGNRTRFLVLSAEALGEAGNKCSLVFTTPHRAGALSRILSLFAEANINLTRVESLPVRNDPEQWAFLLDFQGRSDAPEVSLVLERVRGLTTSFRLLGCYSEARS
jgi:prephenate dehydratase/chorismate mutase/prephenate dehydratase